MKFRSIFFHSIFVSGELFWDYERNTIAMDNVRESMKVWEMIEKSVNEKYL